MRDSFATGLRPTVDAMDNRAEVREFLVSRRARVHPRDVGLPVGANRRVQGLRRSEVATLAGVSVEYYTRLERGSIRGASPQVLDSLARALLLDDAERAHLFDLAHAASPVARPPKRRSAKRWTPSTAWSDWTCGCGAWPRRPAAPRFWTSPTPCTGSRGSCTTRGGCPDTGPVLRALRERGLRIGIVSDFAWDLRVHLDHDGLTGLVDACVLSCEMGREKPDPQLFLKACADMGTAPRATLMVGDKPARDGGATACGLPTYLLSAEDRTGERGLAPVLGIVDADPASPHPGGRVREAAADQSDTSGYSSP